MRLRPALWTTILKFLRRLGCHPCVGLIGNLGKNQQLIPAEGIGVFPLVAFLVKFGETGVESNPVLRFVSPDCGLDRTNPDLVYRFVIFGHRY